MQHSSQGIKNKGLIVHEENFSSHNALLSAVFPAGCARACGGKAQRRTRAACGGRAPLVADARHAAGEEALTCSIGAIHRGNQCRFVKTSTFADVHRMSAGSRLRRTAEARHEP
ncbi:MAG: hypothetical protein P4K93_04845 [Terracidiphilus sp.]|nr:hypothetical protein [Terracidiphilus sp.]